MPAMSREVAENIMEAIEMLRKIDQDLGVAEHLGVELDDQEMLNAYNDAQIVILGDELDAAQKENAELTMQVADGFAEREHLREDIQRLLDINQKQAERLKSAEEIINEAERLLRACQPYLDFVDSIQDGEPIQYWAGTTVPRFLPRPANIADPEAGQEYSDYTDADYVDTSAYQEYIEDDNANLKALQAEPIVTTVPVENQHFSLFNPSATYVPGDSVEIRDMLDSSFNGVYKMGEDRIFHKVSE